MKGKGVHPPDSEEGMKQKHCCVDPFLTCGSLLLPFCLLVDSGGGLGKPLYGLRSTPFRKFMRTSCFLLLPSLQLLKMENVNLALVRLCHGWVTWFSWRRAPNSYLLVFFGSFLLMLLLPFIFYHDRQVTSWLPKSQFPD